MYIKSSLLTFRGNDWCVYTTFSKQVCMYAFSWGLKPSLQNPDIDFLEFPPLPSVLARFMLGKYLIAIKFRKSCSLWRQVLSSCMPLLVQMQPITPLITLEITDVGSGVGRGAGTGYISESWCIFYSKHYLTYSSSFSGSILTLRTLPTQLPIKAFDHQSLLSTNKPCQFLVGLKQVREFCIITPLVYGHPLCIWQKHRLISLLFAGLSKKEYLQKVIPRILDSAMADKTHLQLSPRAFTDMSCCSVMWLVFLEFVVNDMGILNLLLKVSCK